MTGLVGQSDMIYHLAAAVGVQLIVDRPVHTIETNICGSRVVLSLASRLGIPVLLASSSEVYGKSEATPFREDDDVVYGCTRCSRWSYAAGKAIDEFLALAYRREFGLPVVVCRFFNTIGPRQSGAYGMVVPRFVRAALAGEPLEIYGTGRQSRCFVCVFDVIDAITKLMAAPEACGRVFNVGSGEEITINDLAARIVAMTGSNSRIEHVSYERAYGGDFDDMMRRVPSLERIRGAIGYRPKYSLEETLRLVIEDQRGRASGDRPRG
jgi:UDP-glucose 4-epimerase